MFFFLEGGHFSKSPPVLTNRPWRDWNAAFNDEKANVLATQPRDHTWFNNPLAWVALGSCISLNNGLIQMKQKTLVLVSINMTSTHLQLQKKLVKRRRSGIKKKGEKCKGRRMARRWMARRRMARRRTVGGWLLPGQHSRSYFIFSFFFFRKFVFISFFPRWHPKYPRK